MTGIWATMCGKLWADAKPRTTQAGKPMASFQILVPVDQKGATQMVGVVAFKDLAPVAGAWKKGDVISVDGYLTLSHWDDPDGKPRSGLNLLAVKAWLGYRKDQPAEMQRSEPAPGGSGHRA